MTGTSLCKLTIHCKPNTLEHNKPYIIIREKATAECQITEVACPFNTQVKEKEQEKVREYQELKREVGDFGNAEK